MSLASARLNAAVWIASVYNMRLRGFPGLPDFLFIS